MKKIPPRWPYGSLGDLTLEAGQPHYLDFNAHYDYRNVHLKTGSKLIIRNSSYLTSTDFRITTIGVSGNLILDGEIITEQTQYLSKDTNNYVNYTGYTPKKNTSDLISLTYSFIQKKGGSGGGAGLVLGNGNGYRGQNGNSCNPIFRNLYD